MSQSQDDSTTAPRPNPQFKLDHVSAYPEPPGTEPSPYQPSFTGVYDASLQWQDSAQTPAAVPEIRAFHRLNQHGTPTTNHKQEDVTAAELHNPSDALGILARVADSAENGQSNGSSPRGGRTDRSRLKSWVEPMAPETVPTEFAYQPVLEGKITPQTVYYLFNL